MRQFPTPRSLKISEIIAYALIGVGSLNLAVLLALTWIRRPFGLMHHHVSADRECDAAPFVSVHVAIHDEPSALVIATIDALVRSHYDAFEILVVDNNTVDPAVWQPVAAHVDTLPGHVRFFHFDRVRGAKAGALNLALELSDPRTQYVAIVDADYQVAPDFISTAVAACGPDVQFVQFPQAYRHTAGADAVVDELADYFETFPRAANRAQASLLTGTLSLIAADSLRQVGGWPTRSITEDAELGVALWRAGMRGLFIDRQVGRGLLPLDLGGLRTQRRRWVGGNAQTLRGAARSLGRGSAGSLAVLAQLTAWHDLMAIPLLTLISIAAFRLFGWADDRAAWQAAEVMAVLAIAISLAAHVTRAMVGRRLRSLAVTSALLWTSSFGWIAALGPTPLTFRRTPKAQTDGLRTLSFDNVVSVIALMTAVALLAEGSRVSAVVLACTAIGLITAPWVDHALRRAARAPEYAC